MGLAGYILRYGVVMGKALYAAAKAGVNLFKKPTISDKRRKVLDKQRKEYEADEKAGIKAGNKLSDADLLKKLNAQKDKGINNKKLGDRADKIVEKKEKKLLKQEEKANKDHDDAMRSQKSLDKFYSTPKGKKVLKELDDKSYLKKWDGKNKEAVFKTYQQKFAKKVNEGADPRVSGTKTTSSKDRHLMNAPVAATALVGTTASLVHKKKSQKKGK